MQSKKLSKGRMALRAAVLALIAAIPVNARAEPLFDAEGYRLSAYRAPVPDHAEGAQTVGIAQVQDLAKRGALLLDVVGLTTYELTSEGQFLTPEARETLPGAVWLPVVGWGRLEPWQQDYLNSSVARLSGGDPAHPIIVFCKVDCWVSLNVIKRLHKAGYSNLYWFPGGADVWSDAGLPLRKIRPEPLQKQP